MKRPASCVAILGTGSDVGKSIVVTALCRIFANRGWNVAPFKAQNMSNNSHVTLDGLEMGRAQVVQAQAARQEPTVDMNPVLLKPCTDTGAQVIVHGRPIGQFEASDYFARTQLGFEQSSQSLVRLRQAHDLIFMEGAGSCAEVNLRDRDFVNFRMAHAVDAPVLLVGDIDRGGIFAQLIGTLAVLPEEDRQRVKGFIINRFRGDASLFEDGMQWIARRTGLPVLGLIPFFYHIEIDSEDGMPLETVIDPPQGPMPGRVNIAAIRWPHISNFTDFNPLIKAPGVCFHYLARPRDLVDYDLLILPGSKNVRADLDWLRATGWEPMIRRHVGDGGRALGICGGYQMLGKTICDPDGVEGAPGETAGLNLIDVSTVLSAEKILTRTRGVWKTSGMSVDGYEIHMGLTRRGPGLAAAIDVVAVNGRQTRDEDGAVSSDGRIAGTYLHGVFDEPDFRRQFLLDLRPDLADRQPAGSAETIKQFRDRQYDLLAEHFARHLDMSALESIVLG